MNMYQKFKYHFKRLWYFILRKKWKIGWVLHEEVGIVIINDKAISKITIDK